MVTHIYFDLQGTLADVDKMRQIYTHGLGEWMAAHYGQTPQIWQNAYQRIVADWESYYADLNLSGEHMLQDIREGCFRTTRALFRLANVPEPSKQAIQQLAHDLSACVAQTGNALYADVHHVVRQLGRDGYALGVMSHGLSYHTRAVLRGADLEACFTAPIVGPDVVPLFEHNPEFFRRLLAHAGIAAADCWLVDDTIATLDAARSVGMHTAWLNRAGQAAELTDHTALGSSLASLPDLLNK